MAEDAPYINQPLVLALVELRHPRAPLTPGELAGIEQALQKTAPIYRSEVEHLGSFTVDALSGDSDMRHQSAPLHRFITRDRKTSVTFRTEAMSLETVAYPGWTAFLALLRKVLTVRQDIAPVLGVTRIGLRYIDQIRVPGECPPDWSQWITKSLPAPRFDGELAMSVEQQQCAVQYSLDDLGQALTFRYGQAVGPSIAPVSFADQPGGAQPAETGPYFLLDSDASWTLPVDDPLEDVDIDTVVAVADQLHGPSLALFEAVIQPKLRDEVFNRA